MIVRLLIISKRIQENVNHNYNSGPYSMADIKIAGYGLLAGGEDRPLYCVVAIGLYGVWHLPGDYSVL